MLGALVLSGGSWLVDSLLLRSTEGAPLTDDTLIDTALAEAPAAGPGSPSAGKPDDDAVILRTSVAARLAALSGAFGPSGASGSAVVRVAEHTAGAAGATGPSGSVALDAFSMPATWRPAPKAKIAKAEPAPKPVEVEDIGPAPRVTSTVTGTHSSARVALKDGSTPLIQVGQLSGDWMLVSVTATGATFEHVPTGQRVDQSIQR